MSVETNTAGDITVLKVEGDLSEANGVELRAAASAALGAGQRDFVVDLSDAPLCDSTGLEALTWLQRECDEQLALVKLCGMTDTFRKILEITGLNHRFADEFENF